MALSQPMDLQTLSLPHPLSDGSLQPSLEAP